MSKMLYVPRVGYVYPIRVAKPVGVEAHDLFDDERALPVR